MTTPKEAHPGNDQPHETRCRAAGGAACTCAEISAIRKETLEAASGAIAALLSGVDPSTNGVYYAAITAAGAVVRQLARTGHGHPDTHTA